MLYYSEHKTELDNQLKKSLEFNYKIVDIYDDSGLKIINMFADTSTIVDCHYIHEDLYEILLNLALLLRENDYGLFLIFR